MTAKFTVLGNQVLTTSAASITFSSIPGGHKDLVLIIEEKPASGTTNYQLRFNGDTGSNYSGLLAYGDGTSAASFTTTTLNLMAYGGDSSMKALVKAQIQDYSATDKHKTVLARADRANQVSSMMAGRWASTSAITSLEIRTTTADNYGVGSTFRLLGVN